ncbi:phosphoenolpyruvate--protein phosphotransferase [Actinophytocola algeriensis]|uniref:Phosphoenolpyruvate-protein phosphotransferase n=1 Tax=Actinophytocola algeriensis TaxID=1768010 RepID=A0A7W7VBU5_9PSEU|nr:phosphoenolpyruvate--protein phosphotransferase [Actinophytocola algeriensis]MBB4904394.1 phosphotransferase system enzyme I (PtsI) [Actinophytocola algeriensis]MBE1476748.1 phosphotransferase system enzyme I (PtsI) [Actinophytocola algeriensis]
MPELHGLGVSPGRTAGPVHAMGAPPVLPAEVPAPGPDETERAAKALQFVATSLDELAARVTGPAAEVLATQAMMAADMTLAEAVTAKVAYGRPAAWAITDAIADQQQQFASLGGYFAERAADLADLRDRAVAWLLDVPMPGLPRPGVPYVLVADDLSPADTALLDDSVLAIVTRRGGPTSHTAILARARGLPAVVGCAGILDVPDGTPVSVDGVTGAVAEVSPAQAEEIAAAGQEERERNASLTGPGQTADGVAVPLLQNVGGAKDLTPDGAGVGLFRTEFLFLGRTSAPPVAEQETAYRELFEVAGDRKVVLRTLDAGADKPLPFLGLAAEDNPALGVRGLRTSRVDPSVLAEQLEAVARAATATSADVWVMAPMVATAEEAAEFAALVYKAGLRTAGVMIEVPAAALKARQILAEVDFVSLGTNDLSQYTMAADRMNGELADLLDPWQPAVLELVALVASAGQELSKPVGVCGESAGDPLLACVYAGMGITTLSMSAPSVAAVRASLASRTSAECRRLAELALAAPTAESARKAVAEA